MISKAKYDKLLKQHGFERVASKSKSIQLKDDDIFVVKPINHPYIYGRVLKTNVNIRWYVYDFEQDKRIWNNGHPDDIIECVNIYKDFTDLINESRSEPKFVELLCPPMMLGAELWENGGAKVLFNKNKNEYENLVESNCFEYTAADGHFDCEGNPIGSVHELTGDYGMSNDLSLFDSISEALSNL